VKNCPNCNDEQSYSNKGNLTIAIKENRECKKCAHTGVKMSEEARRNNSIAHTGKKLSGETRNKISNANSGENNPFYGKTHSVETRRKISEANIGKIVSDETKQKISNFNKGKTLSDEHKLKIRNSKLGKPGPRLGMTTNDDTKSKMRLTVIQRISEAKFNGNQMMPSYNINSIPIIEQKAKELGITDLQHAENGGEYYIKELGYWVDGYSEEKNIVIEYYEKHHSRQEERDLQRQKEITNLLKCEFIIIKE